jgi:hypothetical protein
MCRLICASLACLLLASCASVRDVPMPVPVQVPVAVRCGPSGVPPAPARPVLDTDKIGPATPIDKLADYWRATGLRLLGYIAALEGERDGLRGYEAGCR